MCDVGGTLDIGPYSAQIHSSSFLSVLKTMHDASKRQRILECLHFKLVNHGWSPAYIRLRRTGG
jgi:hypothetical protein